MDIDGGMWRVEVDIEGDMWRVEVDIEGGLRWILRVVCGGFEVNIEGGYVEGPSGY